MVEKAVRCSSTRWGVTTTWSLTGTASFWTWKWNCALACRGFDSEMQICDLGDLHPIVVEPTNRDSLLLDALVLGLRDYMGKSGFKDCVLGLSGGIDSALACYIAARAVVPDTFTDSSMPSRTAASTVSKVRAARGELGIDPKSSRSIPFTGL